jgi:hypothetical protein
MQFSGQGPLRLNVEQQMPVSQQREGVTANLVAPLMSEAQIADLVAASGRLRDNMVKRGAVVRITRMGGIYGPLADPARQPVAFDDGSKTTALVLAQLASWNENGRPFRAPGLMG